MRNTKEIVYERLIKLQHLLHRQQMQKFAPGAGPGTFDFKDETGNQPEGTDLSAGYEQAGLGRAVGKT